jgi:PAS domain S-box-containing protein
MDPTTSTDLMQTLLDVSLTGIILFRPVSAEPGGPIQDFAYEHLNPAAQRMLQLPECPAESFLTLYPSAHETGIFAFYAGAFASGQTERYEVNYQHERLDGYFHLVARRSGERLVVSFTDTNDQPRSAVEEALRQSQTQERAERQRFYNVLMQLPANVAVYHGPDHHYQLVNPNYQRRFPHRSFVGHPFREGMPESVGLGVVNLFDHVYQTGEPYYGHELEGWFDFSGNGKPEQIFFDLSLHPLRNARGEIDGVIDFSYDVTEQVLARHQLQELNQELESRVRERTHQLEAAQQATERQRQQWHDLFLRAPAGICIFDGPEWVYEFVNPRYQAMFPGRELLGKRLVDALPEVADQPLMTILHRVYDTGEPFEASEVLVPLARTASGPVEDIYFDLTYQARRNETGQIDGFITYAQDVTTRVVARREREAQQGELQRVFEQAPVAIGLFVGEELRITALNPPMALLFGVPADQLLGRPLLEGLPELQGQGFDDLMRQVQTTQVPFVGQELPVTLTRNGEPRVTYYNLVYQPYYGAAGEVEGVFEVAVEVTEQVLARQQVQQLNEELTASNKALHETNSRLVRTNADLDNFVYTASHDLKAPITNIEGLLALLPELLPAALLTDAHVAPVLERMQESIERFRRTITHLTDVSRLQAEFAQPAEPLSLAAIIEDVRQDLHFQFLETGAVLDVAVAGTQPRVFSPKNLRSLMYNLLSNALKYRHPERAPLVHIRCQQAGDSLVLTVQDNGLGLSPAQQQRLFQLFQRLHTHVEGSGVGLYAVKKIVENAHGTITVASQQDVGTTFTLTFPA